MKADDVLTLANKAMKARQMIVFEYDTMRQAQAVGDTKRFEAAHIDFCRYKEEFCSIIDCIAVISKNAGDEYRMLGFNRRDL